MYEIKDQVGWITLNRPEAMNAVNQEMGREIIDACRQAEEDRTVRAAVFIGAGERAFSVGGDVKERARGAHASFLENRQAKLQPGINTPTQAIAAISKPTIALIRGYAIGTGLLLCLACDIRIAAEDAKLGLTEVRLGIIPGSGGTQRLARIVGLAKALEICLCAELVDAREAHRIGLVHRLVSVEELRRVGDEMANSFLKGAPSALRFTKESIYKGFEIPLEEGLSLEANLAALAATTEDGQEGPRAFVEKRALAKIGALAIPLDIQWRPLELASTLSSLPPVAVILEASCCEKLAQAKELQRLDRIKSNVLDDSSYADGFNGRLPGPEKYVNPSCLKEALKEPGTR